MTSRKSRVEKISNPPILPLVFLYPPPPPPFLSNFLNPSPQIWPILGKSNSYEERGCHYINRNKTQRYMNVNFIPS